MPVVQRDPCVLKRIIKASEVLPGDSFRGRIIDMVGPSKAFACIRLYFGGERDFIALDREALILLDEQLTVKETQHG
ncbi:MAG: hypothetical protein ACFFH0_04365 [Promethearchaeota archaeon]